MTEIKREDVRAAIEHAHESSFACAECAFLGPCRRCRTLAVVIALGEQWLKARRARWTPGNWTPASADLTGGGFAGHVYRFDDGTWEAGIGSVPQMLFTTEAEAREWVEARAIADGYEIVREP